jgi:hypothetical protein
MMSDGFYDDWIATEETHDYHCPIEQQLNARLEELERERENNE